MMRKDKIEPLDGIFKLSKYSLSNCIGHTTYSFTCPKCNEQLNVRKYCHEFSSKRFDDWNREELISFVGGVFNLFKVESEDVVVDWDDAYKTVYGTAKERGE